MVCCFTILDGSGDLLLASCAQDAYIRLWRVARKDKATPPSTSSAATGEEGDGVVDEDEGELKLTGNVFLAVDERKVSHQYTVTLESVLMGMHDRKSAIHVLILMKYINIRN